MDLCEVDANAQRVIDSFVLELRYSAAGRDGT